MLLSIFSSEHAAVHAGFWGKVSPYLGEFRERRLLVSFDFSDKLDAPEVEHILPNVDYAFFSHPRPDREIEEFLGWAKARGPRIAIATLGEHGSLAYDGEHFYRHGILPVEVVDTLGAGDAFIAGFMQAVLNDRDIPNSWAQGTESAARVITSFGAWQ